MIVVLGGVKEYWFLCSERKYVCVGNIYSVFVNDLIFFYGIYFILIEEKL